MKIKIFINDEEYTWSENHDPYIIREDQNIYFELTELTDDEIPSLFIEDYELELTRQNKEDSSVVFKSISGRLFRESFGLSIVCIHLGEDHPKIRFEVLVKKVNAQQIEEMIRYLTEKKEDIIRICLSRTTLPVGTKDQGVTDPETILNTVETFVNTLISCHLELQHHLRKRLIPVKQPAWKVAQGDIDPFDIIFNLDALEPVLGEGDVLVNGRSFSIREAEVTTLESTANVKENAILLGGIYSMRRVITKLLNNLNAGFPIRKIAERDSEYEFLSEVLLRLTSSNMRQRCESQLLQLEEFIRYFERKIGVTYQGEYHPTMTPFVRSSRVYRRLFEKLYSWYSLGEPCLDGLNHLVKLRSASKIYEFVALFKIIDYLHEKNWLVVNINGKSDLEFIPSILSFSRDNFKLTLYYEKEIYSYKETTSHLDLVDMWHFKSAISDYQYWKPDFVLMFENNNKTNYLILDAKYSSSWIIKEYSLPDLFDKYFMKMAVYDAYNQCLKQDAILGVIALFPDKNTLPIYMQNWGKHGIYKTPIRLPIVAGLPILPQSDNVAYRAFDRLFELAEKQLKMN